MKKALIIGIDNYPQPLNSLNGCLNDVHGLKEKLSANADGSPNFTIDKTETVENKAELNILLRKLFSGSGDTALFYFAGHGKIVGNEGYIVTPDYAEGDEGVSLSSLLNLANESHFVNRVIILDCCHAGKICETKPLSCGALHIAQGVTVLAACNAEESAKEDGGHGVFTRLMLDALDGGAASIDGEITPSSVYSSVDRSLGAGEQRPLFATNISSRVVLRKANPAIDPAILKDICSLFISADYQFPLNPSFEETNSPEYAHSTREPYALKENVEKLKKLQLLTRAGLVVPVGAEHLYYAAMRSKQCKLTALGKHYWHLAKAGRL